MTKDGQRLPTLTQMREQHVKTNDVESIKITLTPLGLKQKAHQALIEDPNKTWEALQTLIINKDTSLVISAEISGFQQSSSNTVTTDSRFKSIEKTSNEISNMVTNHQINATYDPNNPKMK